MTDFSKPHPKGRGSHVNPPNRFVALHREADLEHVEHDEEYLDGLRNVRTEYFPDASKTIISENDSPDVPFRFSINPYRGCLHGCSYCFARPAHEYLGFSAGLDFETKIFVKESAPELFREFLSRPSWAPEAIVLSGVTDPYQPIERQFELTRRCLAVAVEARQPLSIITKNALILRDLDLLRDMAANQLIHVNLSVTTLDAELARSMEPRTSTPTARLRAIQELTDAGIPVRVLVAPVIPGLTDHETPAILAAAKAAGAAAAGYELLRLPLTVAPVFLDWLRRTQPGQAEKVEQRLRAARGGKLTDLEWGTRMTGSGEIAEQIGNLFRLFARKYGLDQGLPAHDCSRFRPPGWLF